MDDFERAGRDAWKGLTMLAIGVVGLLALVFGLASNNWISTLLKWTVGIVAGVPMAIGVAFIVVAMLWAVVAPVLRWIRRK